MRLLINEPREKYRAKWLEVYAKKANIQLEKLKSLNKYFKDDLYLILSVLELISNDEANDIKIMLEISEFIQKNENKFEDKINSLAEQYKVSTNKIYKLYNEWKELYR